jgi:tetratricopeptide (TPR) repeat protein
MQDPLPAPTATGSFAKTPFPHLLVYALERRLSGTFELSRGALPLATFLVVQGCPAKVRTNEPIHFLGNVMLELGMITPEQLRASLDRMQASPRLQGQILLEMGAIDQARLEAGLRAQVERKIEHLFGLSMETTFSYYDGIDLLQSYGGPPSPIDPFPVLWRGVRESPAWEHVDATLRRVGNALVRASATAQLERFAFTPQEMQAVEMLRHRPVRMVDVASVLGPSVGQLLMYLLMIMKQVDLVDASAVQPNAAPARAPSPPSSGRQAFARVQLQRQVSGHRPGMIVEEVVSSKANDARASSPGMPAPTSAFGPPTSAFGPPTGAFAPSAPSSQPAVAAAPVAPVVEAPPPMTADGALDIGAMISQTIQQSALPPPIVSPAPPASSAPPAPSAPSAPPATSEVAPSSSPSPPSSGAKLTAEQVTLKTKILERAEQITSQNYFQMLGLERDASIEAVQKAFFSLAKVWHPDRLPPALADVKDACSKVFSHLTEAHATLTDPAKRKDYMQLLKEGGATPQDQAKIQAVLEAATEFQKAEFLLKRNQNDPQAYEIVKRCVALDPDQADYMATLAWLDAQKPEWLSREKTLEKIAVLDRCIKKNDNCERAYFYRGMLYKRIDEPNKALKDFKKVAELNPRNLDAMREVRLHNIRGGASKPPPGMGGRTSKAPPADTLGGLFGKLFKK